MGFGGRPHEELEGQLRRQLAQNALAEAHLAAAVEKRRVHSTDHGEAATDPNFPLYASPYVSALLVYN